MNSKLSQLLEQSNSLRNSQLKSLHKEKQQEFQVRMDRPLPQLEAQSKKLLQKTAKNRDYSSEARAQYLLAGRGFDSEKISQTLQAISVAQAFEPVVALKDTDVEGFLRNEHELVLCATLDAVRNRSLRQQHASFERSIQHDWAMAKRVIFESLSHHRLPSEPFKMPAPSSLAASIPAGTSILSTPIPQKTPGFSGTGLAGVTSASSNNVSHMQAYAQVVSQLNDIRLSNKPAPLAKLFSECVKASSDLKAKQSLPCWDLIFVLVSTHSGNHIRERDLARGYSAKYDSPEALEIRRHLLNGSRNWLERSFQEFLRDHVGRILTSSGSNVGPDRMPLLQRLQLWSREVLMNNASVGNWEVIDGYPFWATLFYLIRAGSSRDALEFAAYYEKFLAKTERRFLDYLTAWVTSPDHTLPKKLRSEILNDFNTRIRDGALRSASATSAAGQRGAGLMSTMAAPPLDPYKYLLFRIIGRITAEDNSIPPAVIAALAGGKLGWEDELWIQLYLVRESDASEEVAATPVHMHDQSSTDQYTLKDLYQRYISLKSPAKWSSEGQAPFRYVLVLLLAGEFEKAIQFLWTNNHEIDAVHFSIAFAYYGLLNIPKEVFAMETDIASTTVETTQRGDRIEHTLVHFPRMIQIYLKGFFNRAANPIPATQYAILICLFQDGYLGAGMGQLLQVAEELKSVTYNWIIDTSLETGLIDDFFGSLGSEIGTTGAYRQPGFLDKYWPLIAIYNWDDFKRHLIRPAAVKAEKYSRSVAQRSEFIAHNISSASMGGKSRNEGIPVPSDAEAELQQNNSILLYNLAEEYDIIVETLCARISSAFSEMNLESVCEIVYGALTKKAAVAIFPSYQTDIEKLNKLESLVTSVLEYYSARPSIMAKITPEKRASLSTLLHLTGAFRLVFQVASSLLEFLGNERGYTQMDVTSQGAGYRVRLSSGAHSGLWRKGLALLDDVGLVPLGFTFANMNATGTAAPNHVERSFSMGGGGGGQLGTPGGTFGRSASTMSHRPMSAAFGTPGASSDRSVMSSDVDYSRIAARADGLRQEFSDIVLSQLPAVFLAAELLILVGWFDVRSEVSAWEGGNAEISRKSRQLLSFVSSVTRWFKISQHVHRLLVAMDEVLA